MADDEYELEPESASDPDSESLAPDAPAKPPAEPPKPLPRLVRFTDPDADSSDEPAGRKGKAKPKAEAEPRARTDPAPAPAPPARRRPSRTEDDPPARSKGRNRTDDDDGGDSLDRKKPLEATPEFDTYDARRRVRMLVGVVAGGVLLVALLSLSGVFRGGGGDAAVDEEPIPEAPELALATAPPKPTPARTALEREASVALADARRTAERGNGPATLSRLEAILKSYPQTKAATEAQQALDRARQGLPVFVDVPLVVAQPVAPRPEPKPAEAPAVVAETPRAGPVEPAPVEVAVRPPTVPPEPYRDTGLDRPRAEIPPSDLPAGFRARPEAGVDPSGWPLAITCDQDGSTLVFVPAAVFVQGREGGEATERPAHRVSLSPYYIDQHEVTVAQMARYRATEGTAPSAKPADSGDARANLPAVQVSFGEATGYARWAGKELPTESQWELAARTVDGRPFPWGSSPAQWDRPRRPGQLDPVMSHDRDLSPYGVFDLAGNAREWTADFFRYYDPGSAATVAINPAVTQPGRAGASARVIRGGAGDWSATWRRDMTPNARLADLGFRCVLNLPGEPPPITEAPALVPTSAKPQDPPPAKRATPGNVVPF